MPSYSVRYLNRLKVAEGTPVPSYWRPKTYGECKDLPRPCPFVGCKYHLFLDEGYAGNIRTQKQELEAMPRTCTLDVAEDGGITRKEVSALIGISAERIRQIEEGALTRLMRYVNRKELVNFLAKDHEPGDNAVRPSMEGVRMQSEASDEYQQTG